MIGDDQRNNAAARLEEFLAARVRSVVVAADMLTDAVANDGDSGRALAELSEAAAHAALTAKLYGDETRGVTLSELNRRIAKLASGETLPADVATQLKSLAEEALAEVPPSTETIPMPKESAPETDAHAAAPEVVAPTPPDVPAPEEPPATTAVVPDRVVSLTAEQYDSVHGDEDEDLIGYFLEVLSQRAAAMKRYVASIGKADGRFAYREALDQVEASANYLDIPWLLDLTAAQHAILGDVERDAAHEANGSIADLAEGLGRLTLLSRSREEALAGAPISSMIGAPDEAAVADASVAAPAELDELVHLAAELGRVAEEAARSAPAGYSELRRRLAEIARAVEVAAARAITLLGERSGE